MKKIVLLFMSAMALSLAISCNKDNGLVGGEDVTDPRLNPGGTLMDNGINIVGAWALSDYERSWAFVILNSKGQLKAFYALGRDDYFLDSEGILHAHFSDFEDYTEELETNSPIKSMVELVCIVFEEDHSYEDDINHERTINNKKGQFVCTWSWGNGKYNSKREGTIKNKDIDTYIANIEEDIWYAEDDHWQDSYTVYLRRIKGFSD